MARHTPSGTPTRATRYLIPKDRRLSVFATAAGVLLALLIVGIYQAGRFYAPARAVLSPGDLANAHAPLDMECALCHQTGSGIGNLGCERCHDPALQERVTHAAHIVLGSGDAAKAEHAEELPCARCHAEHGGREPALAVVDDRECAACHGFATLRSHPEFAAVRAGATSGRGLVFNHMLHLERVRKAQPGADACQRCHLPSSDRSGFMPIAFDRSCATCHVEDGVLARATVEGVAEDAIVRPAAMERPLPAPEWPSIEPGPRQTVNLTRLKHRDPWVIYNALRLRRIVDPDGEASEHGALRAQEDWLSRQLDAQQAPLSTAVAGEAHSGAPLETRVTELDARVADLDRRLAAQPEEEAAALARMAATVAELKNVLASNDPTLAADAGALASTTAATRPSGTASGDVAQRRTELTQALDAVAARGQPELASRAAELRRRVDALAPPAGAAEAARYDGSRSAELQLGQASRSAELQLGPDAVALDRALSSLDEPIRVLGRMSDPAARFEAAQLAGGRAVARQYLGGLSPDDVDARRREMLAVLDAVSRAGGPAIAGRVAELRHRVLAVSSPQDGEASLRRERREAALLRDRLRLELELGETARRFGPSTAPRGSDVEVRTRLDSVRARLALLRAGPRPAAALDDAMQRRFGQELEMLMDACTNCHTMTGPRLDPVIVAQPTLERSRFTHRPHVTQTGCVTCHKMVEESRRAADANITGVDTCRQCHGASKAPERCTTCHVYHPKSLAHLLPAL